MLCPIYLDVGWQEKALPDNLEARVVMAFSTLGVHTKSRLMTGNRGGKAVEEKDSSGAAVWHRIAAVDPFDEP